MIRSISILFIFSLITSSLSGQTSKGYNISLEINGLEDSFVSIAYHLGDKQYIKDTVRTNTDGLGIFSGEEALDQGLYMVVMPDNQYFELLITGDQDFSLKCDRSDFINSLEISGSEENIQFIDYRRNWIALQEKANAIRTRIEANQQNNDSLSILLDMRKEHEESMLIYLKSVSSKNFGSLIASLINAMLPLDIPEFEIPPGSSNPDSLRWVLNYHYNKAHFFDNTDLTDERLIRTPILLNKLKTYFSNVLIQVPDSIIKEIPRFVDLCGNNEEVYRYVVVFLFNHFRDSQVMGHDAIIVYLADEYYLSGKADWVSEEFIADLNKDISRLRSNLIGVKATDLVMETFDGPHMSLYDIKKEFTIIYFWEPDCGHCKESTPVLKEFYANYRESDIEIFAVCTQDNREEWEAYIADNELEWINGWDPMRSTHFDFYYNVTSTPMVYILNKNKEIIAKKLPVESIEGFLDNYRKFGM